MNEEIGSEVLIFNRALALSGEELSLYLEQACDGDERLKLDILELVQAAARSGSILDSETRLRTAVALARSRDWRRLAPGTIIGDRFQIVRYLGRGGAGEVYRARDLKLGDYVALKTVSELAQRDILIQEVKQARKVTHPNVCRVHDFVETPESAFLSMEYVEGEDLQQLISRVGKLDNDVVARLFQDICLGLAAAHRTGLIHRDLKPSNILINEAGSALVSDFGIAVDFGFNEQGVLGPGTPAYMAPEQALKQEVSVRSDIYSLGLILYAMLTGETLLPEDSVGVRRFHLEQDALQKLNGQNLDDEWARILTLCLAKAPMSRPGAVENIIAELPGATDPLASALLAKRTPSPILVMASGGSPGLSRRSVVVWSSVAMVALVGRLALDGSMHILTLRPWPLTEAELLGRAVESLDALAPGSSTNYWRSTILLDTSTLESFEPDGAEAALSWVRDGVPSYAYFRTSFSKAPIGPNGLSRGGVSTVDLSPEGHLIRFKKTYDESEESSAPIKDVVSEGEIFSLTGLNMEGFERSVGEEVAGQPVSAESQSWRSIGSDSPVVSVSIRREEGRVNSFSVAANEVDEPLQPNPFVFGEEVNAVIVLLATPIAFFNQIRGRTDLRGAGTLMVTLGILALMLGVFEEFQHWASDRSLSFIVLLENLSVRLFGSLILFLACEPFIRRRWPELLVTSTRLLHGRLLDPRVGRDVFVGIVFCLICYFVVAVSAWLDAWSLDLPIVSGPLEPGSLFDLSSLSGLGRSAMTRILFPGVWTAQWVFLLALVYAMTRRKWVCLCFFGTLYPFLIHAAYGVAVVSPSTASMIMIALGLFWLISRYGALALLCFTITASTLAAVAPVQVSFMGSWMATWIPLLIILGPLVFGAIVASRRSPRRVT